MSLFRTIIALGSAVSAVLVAYAFGYALSTREPTPFLFSGVALVVAVVLVLLQVRPGRDTGAGH
jgi:hypothetical protein